MSSSVKHVRVVAALIPSTSGRYLVQQRLPNKSRANLWEFPGGKVEAGETDEAALARECREELDVELEVGRRLWGTTHEYADLVITLELFAATIVQGEPKALGAQGFRFCTFDEMRTLPFCEADVPLLEGLAKGEISAT
jgi:8-oxo-dGTP diphosphatase